ncbi:MAG: ATP-binding protein [Desertifilum sp.]|nr:ATP-binding protein [Desertifilum sp.]
MDTLRASEQGLEIIDRARRQKRWTKTETSAWWETAYTSQATLKRFWRKLKIDRYSFIEICQTVGVDWQEVAEPELEVQRTPVNCSIKAFTQIDYSETRWVGRQDLIAKLYHLLQNECRVLSIIGLTGIGKTALATRLMLELNERYPDLTVKTVCFDREVQGFQRVASQVLGENLSNARQLQNSPELLLNKLLNYLQNNPCLLVLDMVEEILVSDGKGGYQFSEPTFSEFLHQIVKRPEINTKLVITSQYQLPTIGDGRYLMRTYTERLSGLGVEEGFLLFETWNVYAQNSTHLDYLKRIIDIYEGHPLALRIIAGEVRDRPYNGNIQLYWQDYGYEIEEAERLRRSTVLQSRLDKPRLDRFTNKLFDLVRSRVCKAVERLYTNDKLACLMLCQGAIYRQPVERKAWLLLIHEYGSIEQASIAFQNLQRRCLIESEQFDSQVVYRLHPLLRRVALEKLDELEEEIMSW